MATWHLLWKETTKRLLNRHCHTNIPKQSKGIPFKINEQEALEGFLYWCSSNPLGIGVKRSSLAWKTLHIPLFTYEANIQSSYTYEKTSLGQLFWNSLVNPRQTYSVAQKQMAGTEYHRYECSDINMQLYAGPEPLLGHSKELRIPYSALQQIRLLTDLEKRNAQEVSLKEDLVHKHFEYMVLRLERERIGKRCKRKPTDVAHNLDVNVVFESTHLRCIYIPVYEVTLEKTVRCFRYWINGITGMVSGDPVFSGTKAACTASAGFFLVWSTLGMTQIFPEISTLEFLFQSMGISCVVFAFLAHSMSASQWTRSGMKLNSYFEEIPPRNERKEHSKQRKEQSYGQNDPFTGRRQSSSHQKAENVVVQGTLPNYYDVLGVDPHASSKEIKAAFYHLVMKYHPDRFPQDVAAAEKIKQILEAYSVLSDRKYFNFDDAVF
eukprot:jgi/Galph1/468/GphlegSOOS_G5163.1